ncbi:potassium channel family protein [Ensifer soli]|uniref:potassium channel family protein n=1 Tax=Ciceribacter sp. sgz301302 TaxID=3342379 RepID=UPI0035B8964E
MTHAEIDDDALTTHPITRLRRLFRALYHGNSPVAFGFQISLAVIDLLIIAFFVFGPYLRTGPSYLIIDYVAAVWIFLELAARALIARGPREFLARPTTWVDAVVLATLLFPALLLNFAFLRALRIWTLANSRMMRSLLKRCRLKAHEDVIRASINLVVFLFLVTGFVYTFFFYHLDGISGFVDALYFTVATVTTTGFGDITLPGTAGKLTSIIAMIIGISLFVRLAQAVVRPLKVTFPCPRCGLQRHDTDAVHCKACGEILNIPDEGH